MMMTVIMTMIMIVTMITVMFKFLIHVAHHPFHFFMGNFVPGQIRQLDYVQIRCLIISVHYKQADKMNGIGLKPLKEAADLYISFKNIPHRTNKQTNNMWDICDLSQS